MSIPFIPCGEPFASTVDSPEPEFTVADGLTWLGISADTYTESARILRGRHGNPIDLALLDARAAQGTDITPGEILARYGIDPADPLVAVRAYDRRRAATDR